MKLMNNIPDILINSIDTLKNTSFDHKNNEYMTENNMSVIDFDKVKEKYVEEKLCKVNPNPKSNDALYINNNHMTFIEFKNGNINNNMNFEINKKIYDSLFILFDIMFDSHEFRSCISYSRQHIDYILVYNEEKYRQNNQTTLTVNGLNRQKLQESKSTQKLQESRSKDKLIKSFAKLANKEYILFGLDQFQGYFFNNVYTYTKDEFDKKFVSMFKSE